VSIAQREDAMVKFVKFVENFTLIERKQLFVQRLNNNLIILVSQQKLYFLARKHN